MESYFSRLDSSAFTEKKKEKNNSVLDVSLGSCGDKY